MRCVELGAVAAGAKQLDVDGGVGRPLRARRLVRASRRRSSQPLELLLVEGGAARPLCVLDELVGEAVEAQ